MKKFYLFSFLFLFFLCSLTSFGQTDPYPYRSLYVDKFVGWVGNNFPTINESKTLLGRTTEEDSLLNFARDNNFKCLVLYDLNRVFAHSNDSLPGASIGGSHRTYIQALCDFIVKAKSQFCIEHIGAALSSNSILNDITNFNSLMITDPYIFNSSPNSFIPFSPNPLAFVQNNYTSLDGPMAMRSEMVKTALRISDFNSFCSAKIDAITTEYEFWQQYKYQGCMISDTVFYPDSMTFISHGVTYSAPFSMTLDNNKTISIPNNAIVLGTQTFHPTDTIVFCWTNDQFWAYRQLLIDIKNVQAGSSYPLISDTYLGWFDKDNVNNLLQAGIIDSLVDRIGLHIYKVSPSGLWNYMANRDSLFGHDTIYHTIIHPIVSAEDTLLGGENFLGPWLKNQAGGNTLFEAEKALIAQYTPNAAAYHNNNVPLQFGAFTWFAQSFFKQKIIGANRYYLPNVLFNRPPTTCSGQNVFFNYIGPNESGMTMVWKYGDGIQDSIVSPDTTQQNRNHVFNSGGTYLVSCTLYYPAPTDTGIGGCAPYTYRDTVFISGATITATGSTSICQGDSVRLTASSGSSYLWTGGATTQSIYVKTTGTYSVTVTNSNGCSGVSMAIIAVTVHQKPSNSLSIVSTPCMGGTSGIISAATTGGTTPFHYLWSNGTTSNPLDTISAGTYFVTVTDSIGCSDRDTIALAESLTCCGMGLLNAPPNITTLVSNSSYNVNGNVTVNGNVSVSNTKFYMGDLSQITIGSASILTMNSCHLSACDSMWNGISFTDNTSLLILNGDTIEDAYQAISDSASARITVSNTVFNKNRRGIVIVGSATALASSVTNCTFTSENSGLFLQTKDGGSAYSGIEMSDMNGWTLNTNHFYHLYYGVKSENSSLVLSGCTFNDMRRYSYTYSHLRAASWTWVNDGYGIYSNNSSASPISLSVQGNTFRNCGYGVATKNSIITEVTGSTFDSLRYAAITVVNPVGVEIQIHNNAITHSLNGISVTEPRVATNTFIHDNTFTTSSNLNTAPLHNAAVNWSVKLQNRLPGVTTATINDNYMNDQLKGIYLNGCEQVEVNSNNIQLIGAANTSKQYGIWLVNSPNCTVANDSIVVMTAGITDPSHARGIRFESSTGCSINNNYFLNLGSGINGLNFCDSTTLCGNDIWNCVRGMDVFNITLPAQGGANSPEDNIWRNIALANRTVGSGNNIPFYHRYLQNDPNNKFSPGTNFIIQSIQNTTGLSPCSVPDTFPQLFTEITDEIISDSIVFLIYNEENRWFGEKYAFHLLSKDSMLMNQGLPTDQQRKDFFDNLKDRNVGELEDIQKVLDEKDYLQAITKLINFQPENVIEQNLKDAFNAVEKVQTENPLSADDSLLLDDIAEQLAFEGGPGVFIARAIMDEEYDDELTGSLLRQSNEQLLDEGESILIYPNPSNGNIIISKDFSKYGACRIDVCDLQSRVLLSSHLDKNETLFEKDLSFLTSGVYAIKIYCDDAMISSLKLVIQR